MDIERTMEFILAQQGKMAESQYKADQRADRADRQIQVIRKLVQTGMKLVIQIAAAQKKTAALVAVHEQRLARLEERQVRTEANIERMLAALIRQRPNGRH